MDLLCEDDADADAIAAFLLANPLVVEGNGESEATGSSSPSAMLLAATNLHESPESVMDKALLATNLTKDSCKEEDSKPAARFQRHQSGLPATGSDCFASLDQDVSEPMDPAMLQSPAPLRFPTQKDWVLLGFECIKHYELPPGNANWRQAVQRDGFPKQNNSEKIHKKMEPPSFEMGPGKMKEWEQEKERVERKALETAKAMKSFYPDAKFFIDSNKIRSEKDAWKIKGAWADRKVCHFQIVHCKTKSQEEVCVYEASDVFVRKAYNDDKKLRKRPAASKKVQQSGDKPSKKIKHEETSSVAAAASAAAAAAATDVTSPFVHIEMTFQATFPHLIDCAETWWATDKDALKKRSFDTFKSEMDSLYREYITSVHMAKQAFAVHTDPNLSPERAHRHDVRHLMQIEERKTQQARYLYDDMLDRASEPKMSSHRFPPPPPPPPPAPPKPPSNKGDGSFGGSQQQPDQNTQGRQDGQDGHDASANSSHPPDGSHQLSARPGLEGCLRALSLGNDSSGSALASSDNASSSIASKDSIICSAASSIVSRGCEEDENMSVVLSAVAHDGFAQSGTAEPIIDLHPSIPEDSCEPCDSSNKGSNCKLDYMVEGIEIMLQQEQNDYKTVDYLALSFQLTNAATCDKDNDRNTPEPCDSTATHSSVLNQNFREKLCMWQYELVDHFNISRLSVGISMNYLDRYFSTRCCKDKKHLYLVSATCLQLAVKINEQTKLPMDTLVQSMRGTASVYEMIAMEMEILRSFDWKVNPPTARCFLEYLSLLIPASAIKASDLNAILESARSTTDLSVIDYYFVTKKPSHVAVAALLNAMEDFPLPRSCIFAYCNDVAKCTSLDISIEVAECRARLRSLEIAQEGVAPLDNDTHAKEAEFQAHRVTPLAEEIVPAKLDC